MNALLKLNCTDFTDIPESQRHVFVDAFGILGEPFLLALDALDKRRITRIRKRSTGGSMGRSVSNPSVYLGRDSKGGYHEIRLGSWNCSCPQFIFMAYQDGSLQDEQAPQVQSTGPQLARDGIIGLCWGGRYTKQTQAIPYCKHVIACVLLEYGGPVFASLCREETVDDFDFTI